MAQDREAQEALTATESRALHRTLRRWLLVVVVLVTGLATLVNWALVDREPEDPVRTWLQGLVEGRSRQLLSGTEEVRADPTLNVFSNRVYRGAAGRIDGWELLGTEVSGDRAEVRVRVHWDEPGGVRAEEHVYGVHRVHRTGPLNDHWALADPDAAVVGVHLPAPLDAISVNGDVVRIDARERVPDAEGPGGTWRFEALPGRYAVGLPGNSYYEVDPPLEPVELDFRRPRRTDVDLRLSPSPRMWEETDARIREWLGECMAAEELAPEGCPASVRRAPGGAVLEPRPSGTPTRGSTAVEDDAEIEDVAWRLLSRPALVLVQDPEDPLHWTADPYRPAVAELSYREDGERVVERVEFPVGASVRSTGGSAEISVGPEPAQ
ncbi:hypothetical protein AS188_02955 [Kocuria flava]|uniref:DUF4179 domain-containing protein n=1 Tax=Kocuria flava TaxID=446860 RepID=A0A0U3G1N2_9MICC|nr:hypothetical protein [Kocuria flava]ALU38874.1 hypothetical protein AS188_02955 [Kocuria flava]GEO91088.1 hypothetical protein KFL01_03940 [Kocuria flava]